MRQPVRVVLADDHDAFVEGLGMVLSAEDDLEVVALAGDGASALQAVLTHHPDVLLLAEDARLEPSTRPDPGGPAGMTRAVSARELADAIRAVAAGFRVVMADPPAPRAAGHGSPDPRDPGTPNREGSRSPGGLLHPVHSPDQAERDLHTELLLRSLSERERQILALLARGYSNRRIAEACYLSLNTVRTHVQNVLVKLGVHSKLEAAALAVRQGLVRIEDHPV
jgi:DNA-binding NarL/FixJ family response regulator